MLRGHFWKTPLVFQVWTCPLTLKAAEAFCLNWASLWLVCVCVCAFFSTLLTSNQAGLATSASVRAGRVRQAHLRHLDSGPSLSNQLPGSLSQLPPPLSVPLLQEQCRQTQDGGLISCILENNQVEGNRTPWWMKYRLRSVKLLYSGQWKCVLDVEL